MILTQLKYDLRMFFRELFYLAFTLIMPPACYLFMGQMFGGQDYGGLNYSQFYTPSFIILITFSVVFFAFGFDNVMTRASGIEKRISVSPANLKTLVISNILKSIIITTLGFVSIIALGIFVYNIEITFGRLALSYGVFIVINSTLLTMSLACYSFFNEMKSALVFSIVSFQVVMFTGDFSVPVAKSASIIQIIAKLNPVYHLNHLFIDTWNNTFQFNKDTMFSIAYVIGVIIIALLVLKVKTSKKRG